PRAESANLSQRRRDGVFLPLHAGPAGNTCCRPVGLASASRPRQLRLAEFLLRSTTIARTIADLGRSLQRCNPRPRQRTVSTYTETALRGSVAIEIAPCRDEHVPTGQ